MGPTSNPMTHWFDVEVRCHDCHQWHRLQKPYADKESADHEHVYFECDANRYFAGVNEKSVRLATRGREPEGVPVCNESFAARVSAPSEPLFEFYFDHALYQVELRDHRQWGVEAQVL
jgi:hypothetical protein